MRHTSTESGKPLDIRARMVRMCDRFVNQIIDLPFSSGVSRGSGANLPSRRQAKAPDPVYDYTAS